MDQDIEEIRAELKRIADISVDNHRILRSLQSRANLALLAGSLKWIVFIAVTLGAVYFIQPYLDKTIELYQRVSNAPGVSTSTVNLSDLTKYIRF